MSLLRRMHEIIEASSVEARMDRLITEAAPNPPIAPMPDPQRNPTSGNHTKQEFDHAFKTFMHAAQKLVDQRATGNLNRKQLGSTIGPKWIRVFEQDVGQDGKLRDSRSVYCFVEKATGYIYKPDGWKRPAKGVRGSIFSANPVSGVTAYGTRRPGAAVREA